MFYDLVDVLYPQSWGLCVLGAETPEHIITVCPALVRTRCATLGRSLLEIEEIRAISSGKILELPRNSFRLWSYKLSRGKLDFSSVPKPRFQ